MPVIKVTGWEVWVGDRRDRWGLVRFAKDPQKLKNYWRSVSAETLALAPKAQWLVPTQGDATDGKLLAHRRGGPCKGLHRAGGDACGANRVTYHVAGS